MDVDAAELSNLIGCVSNKTQEVSAEVGMNLGCVDVGKVVGARATVFSVAMVPAPILLRIRTKHFAARRL